MIPTTVGGFAYLFLSVMVVGFGWVVGTAIGNTIVNALRRTP